MPHFRLFALPEARLSSVSVQVPVVGPARVQQLQSVPKRALQHRVGEATMLHLLSVPEPMFYPVLTAMMVLFDPVPPAAITTMLPVLWVLHRVPEVVLPRMATDLTLPAPRPPRLFLQGTLLIT